MNKSKKSPKKSASPTGAQLLWQTLRMRRLSPTNGKYKLVGRKVVPVNDLYEWAEWLEGADLNVKKTIIDDVARVSTVFIGLDMGMGYSSQPLIFETMTFSTQPETMKSSGRVRKFHPVLDGIPTRRYSTWAQAERGHRLTCTEVKAMLLRGSIQVDKILKEKSRGKRKRLGVP